MSIFTDRPASKSTGRSGEVEVVEPVAKVLGEGGGGGDRLSGFGMRKAQLGGVEHLAGNFGEVGAEGIEILAVAEDGIADVVKMDANLMGTAGLDGDGDVGAAWGAGLRGDLAHVADGGQMIDVLADIHGGGGQVAGDEGVVELANAAVLELGDEGFPGLFGLGEEDAARGVLVEAVDGEEVGEPELGAQADFEGFVAGGEEARGFVDDKEEGIVEEDAERGRRGGLRGKGIGKDFDGVAGLEEMLGHPDAAAVDKDEAVVEEILGAAAGEGEVFGEMVE